MANMKYANNINQNLVFANSVDNTIIIMSKIIFPKLVMTSPFVT
jgi:hypothetical protein